MESVKSVELIFAQDVLPAKINVKCVRVMLYIKIPLILLKGVSVLLITINLIWNVNSAQ